MQKILRANNVYFRAEITKIFSYGNIIHTLIDTGRKDYN